MAQIDYLITRDKAAARLHTCWLFAQLATGVTLLWLTFGLDKNPVGSVGASLVLFAAKIPWDQVKLGRDRLSVFNVLREELASSGPGSARARQIDSDLRTILHSMAGARGGDKAK